MTDLSAAQAERARLLARFYDLEYKDYTEDIDFYVHYALNLFHERDVPILELGCGTGRILLALAARGFAVTGVDSDPAMLEICAEHARNQALADKVRLVQADMRDLTTDLGKGYGVIYCALNTFAYLLTTADQLRMLRSAARLLARGGKLILDTTPPLHHLMPPTAGDMVYQGTYPDGSSIVHKFVTGHEEPATQRHGTRVIYDVEGADGTLKRYSAAHIFRWTGRYEMELLLEAAGLKLDALYGGYELDEYTDASERMIFVARL